MYILRFVMFNVFSLPLSSPAKWIMKYRNCVALSFPWRAPPKPHTRFFMFFKLWLQVVGVVWLKRKSMPPVQYIKRFGGRMPLFLFIFIFITYIHSINHNTFIRRHSLKPLSISSSLVCSVVPSRESNSGLPYSKPTRCRTRYIVQRRVECSPCRLRRRVTVWWPRMFL